MRKFFMLLSIMMIIFTGCSSGGSSNEPENITSYSIANKNLGKWQYTFEENGEQVSFFVSYVEVVEDDEDGEYFGEGYLYAVESDEKGYRTLLPYSVIAMCYYDEEDERMSSIIMTTEFSGIYFDYEMNGNNISGHAYIIEEGDLASFPAGFTGKKVGNATSNTNRRSSPNNIEDYYELKMKLNKYKRMK